MGSCNLDLYYDYSVSSSGALQLENSGRKALKVLSQIWFSSLVLTSLSQKFSSFEGVPPLSLPFELSICKSLAKDKNNTRIG